MRERHIAFIDILGIRSSLALGHSSFADSKIRKLATIVEEVIPNYPGVYAHGATDFFVLWSSDANLGWYTAIATREIFRRYFDLNLPKSHPLETYLLRGGLAYGEVDEIKNIQEQFTYSLLLGNGLAKAYEAQSRCKGMRLVLAPQASRAFRPTSIPGEERITSVKVDKHHKTDGKLEYSEIRWIGIGAEVDERVRCSSWLFRQALSAYRRKEIPAEVVLHYQQTLCAALNGCSSPQLLLHYLNFRHQQKRAYPFLGSVWGTAWLRLFRPKNSKSINENRNIIWEKFLIMSGSTMINEVSSLLSRYNRWRPLIRFLKKGELRFGSRNRKRSPR